MFPMRAAMSCRPFARSYRRGREVLTRFLTGTPEGLEVSKPDQPVLFFIPQTKSERFQATQNGHRLHGLKERLGPMT